MAAQPAMRSIGKRRDEMTVTPPHPSIHPSLHPSISHLLLFLTRTSEPRIISVPLFSNSFPALHFDGERRMVDFRTGGDDATTAPPPLVFHLAFRVAKMLNNGSKRLPCHLDQARFKTSTL